MLVKDIEDHRVEFREVTALHDVTISHAEAGIIPETVVSRYNDDGELRVMTLDVPAHFKPFKTVQKQVQKNKIGFKILEVFPDQFGFAQAVHLVPFKDQFFGNELANT